MPEDLFRPPLGEPHHHAYVVEDIEATVKRLVDQLGAGPFFLIENVPLENVVSRGEPAEFVHNSAFGALRRRRDRADPGPEPGARARREGLLRLRGRASSTSPTSCRRRRWPTLRSSLDERGLPQYLSSQLGGVETTLHDASATLGHDIEIHVDNEGLRGFFGMVTRRRRGLGRLGAAAPGSRLSIAGSA